MSLLIILLILRTNIDHNEKDGWCTFYQNALLLAVGNCLKKIMDVCWRTCIRQEVDYFIVIKFLIIGYFRVIFIQSFTFIQSSLFSHYMLAMHSGKMYMLPSCSLHIYGQIQVVVWGLQGTSTLLRKILWQAYNTKFWCDSCARKLDCLKHN